MLAMKNFEELQEFIENFKYHHLSNSWKHYKTWKNRLL